MLCSVKLRYNRSIKLINISKFGGFIFLYLADTSSSIITKLSPDGNRSVCTGTQSQNK